MATDATAARSELGEDDAVRKLTGAWLAIAGRIRGATLPALRARAAAAYELASQLPTMVASEREGVSDPSDLLSRAAFDVGVKAAVGAIETRAFGWDQEAARLQGFAEASERHASELLLLARTAQDASSPGDGSEAVVEPEAASQVPPRGEAGPSKVSPAVDAEA